MKRFNFLLLALFFSAFSSCDLFDDSPCGPYETYDLYLLGSSIVDTMGGIYYSYLDNGTRVFQYSSIVENVCPEEHVKFDGRVALLDETVTDISARCKLSWLFLFEESVAMSKNGTDFKGSGSAGLKQAFGESPGWFIPNLEVYFPTKGSYGADTAFLKRNVLAVEMKAKYRKL